MARRFKLLKQVIDGLNRQLDEEQRLCNIALHQLAGELNEKNVPQFIMRWRREHLAADRKGLM